MAKQLLYALVFFLITNAYSQKKEPRFTSFNSGQAFTAITVDGENRKVWAGTNKNGVYSLDTNAKTLPKDFIIFNSGSSPDLSTIAIKDMAADGYGTVWIAHQGVNFNGGSGGLEAISSNLTVRHYSPDRNALGFKYFQRDGLGGLRLNSIAVDKNNRVWTVNRNHHLTTGGKFILTPGAYSYKDYFRPKFTTVGAWFDDNGGIADKPIELPYPAYTEDPKPDENPQNRNMQAISTDDDSVWMGSWGYVPKIDTDSLIPNRILKYDLEGKFLKQFTQKEMQFPGAGIINGICANGAKGTWVTTSIKGNGFSVYKDGTWYNLSKNSQILPQDTRFNDNAIWKDKIGRVFLGTDKGLIVYNGYGAVDNSNSYKIYTNYDYGATTGNKHNIFDPTMLSSNITNGCGDPNNAHRSWIASDKGIMKLFLPIEGMQLYHIRDHSSYNRLTKNTEDNIGLITTLKNELKDLVLIPEIPSIAADSSASTLFRFKTDDPIGHYKNPSSYRLYVGPGPIEKIDEEDYRRKYGYFYRKDLKSYEGSPTVADSLKHVEYTYQHPEYIDKEDYKSNKNYAEYEFRIVDVVSDPSKPKKLYKHPIRIAVPPILLGHGVWSDVRSVDTIEDFLNKKGYKGLIMKAWRSDREVAENTYEEDAHIIPEYIQKLKRKAASNLLSAGKVNVIAHSRGGIYARAYIENLEQPKYRRDINSLITLNTPHSGAQGANLVMDRRLIKLSYLTGSTRFLPYPISNLNPLKYIIKDIRIGKLVSILDSDTPPKNDTIKQNGAKHLMVVSDYLSGTPIEENPKFIERLNYKSNLTELKQVPIHAVATTFKACDAGKIYCNDISATIGDIIFPGAPKDDPKRRLPKAFFRLIWVYNAFSFLTNGIPKTIDGFTEYLYRNSLDEKAENDFVVPLKSMEAGLGKQYKSNFSGENIPHSEFDRKFLVPNATPVTQSTVVLEKLSQLIRENVHDESLSFTRKGLKPPTLNYLFLAGWFGDTSEEINQDSISKIFINKDPDVFNNNISEGNELKFNVYAENLDKFMIAFENENSRDSIIYSIKKPIKFENAITYKVPYGHSGKTTITASGYKEGKIKTIDTVWFKAKPLASTTLQSIKFEKKEPVIREQENYYFNIIGKFSDDKERIINNYEGLEYTIQDSTIVTRSNTTLKGNIVGHTIVTASLNDLKTSTFITVEKNTALYKTILSNFYGELNQDNDEVKITWKTLREYKNKAFVLEKSNALNGNFTEITRQSGNGTSEEASTFNYTDTALDSQKVIFYRLKFISETNEENYSTTIKIDRSTLSSTEQQDIINNSLKLYPNPVKSGLVTLAFQSKFSSKFSTLDLYSLEGKKLFSQNLAIKQGDNKFSINLSEQLNNGIYLIKVTTPEFIKSVKLVVNK